MSQEHFAEERFVYVTYIATTPEKVWEALTSGELTRQYWRHDNVSDWKPGSPWQMIADDDTRAVHVAGRVLESLPPKRLVLSWGDPAESPEATALSRAALDIEVVGDMVRLTITHDRLTPDMARRISGGWPLVFASLKSLLETGRPLDIYAK